MESHKGVAHWTHHVGAELAAERPNRRGGRRHVTARVGSRGRRAGTGGSNATRQATSTLEPGTTIEQPQSRDASRLHKQIARVITAGIGGNTITALDWSEDLMGKDATNVAALQHAMAESAERVKDGNLGGAEAMLMAQAISLNSIFVNLAARANATEYVEHLDRFARLALKAQSQCRATIETLAMMKNPPVFARQANIATGSQQVNNGIVNHGIARAEIQETSPNKLLEARGERMDRCAEGETGTGDSALETVETCHGPAHGTREGACISQRVPRRRAAKVPG